MSAREHRVVGKHRENRVDVSGLECVDEAFAVVADALVAERARSRLPAVAAAVMFGIGGAFGADWENREVQRYLQHRGATDTTT